MEPTTAKQFLITRVIEEAQAEQVHLTAVEIKMLYFTEAQPMTPDMVQAVTEFEGRDLSEEYEDKIVALLKSARNRDLAQSQSYREMWTEAVAALEHEDHYILVMVYSAFPEHRKSLLPAPPVRDYVIYVVIGIAVVLAIVGISVSKH
ncbi:MAG: hypothetical protein QOF56_2742 [Acidobacteriaceae bacterium]|jgi:hypothetical protein|nr:hypothetical protein [Acidobacteriaceae bacterium]